MSDDSNEKGRAIEALRNATRRSVVANLVAADGPTSPSDLARSLDLPLSNVAYHFRVLAEAGALKLVRTEPVRGSSKHFYAPCPEFIATPAVREALRLRAE